MLEDTGRVLTRAMDSQAIGTEGVDLRVGAALPNIAHAIQGANLVHPLFHHAMQPTKDLLPPHGLFHALVQALLP